MPKYEIIKVTANKRDIQLSVSDDLPSSSLNVIIPQVLKLAIEEPTKNIVSAIVELYEETHAKIVFYQEYGRILREEIIPVIAKAKAYQSGRDMLNSMGLDDDILKDAQAELNKLRRFAGDSTTDAPPPDGDVKKKRKGK